MYRLGKAVSAALGPSLDLDCCAMQSWPQGASFSRASKAWDHGFTEYAIDIPRLSADGLLIEGQRSNLETDNDFLANWSIPGAPDGQDLTIGMTGPDGLVSAAAYGDASSTVRAAAIGTGPLGTAGTYAASIYVFKDDALDNAEARFRIYQNSSHYAGISVNPKTGVSTVADGSPKILQTADLGSWWRVGFSVDIEPQRLEISAALASVAAQQTVIFARPQCEIGGFMSSPILTDGVAATRAADIATLPLERWFNPDAGTLLVEFSAYALEGWPRVFSINGGSDADELAIYLSTAGAIGASSRIAGSGEIDLAGGADELSTDSTARAVISYDRGAQTLKICRDGGLVQSGTGTLPAAMELTTLSFGSSLTDNFMFGHIRRLVYWPTALADGELQRITA